MNPTKRIVGCTAAAAIAAWLSIPTVDACKGTPRTPCSKSVVLNVIRSGTVAAAPGGGSVTVRLNDIPVTLTANAGDPRLCTIDASVRVAFNDGMVLENLFSPGLRTAL